LGGQLLRVAYNSRSGNLWSSGGIPIIQAHNVIRKTKQAYEIFRLLNKTPKRNRDAKTKQIISEEKLFNKLFDIASRRSKDLRSCNCPLLSCVPSAEITFLRDRRGARKMKLGGVDYEETSRRHNTANRRQKRERNERRNDTDQAAPSRSCVSHHRHRQGWPGRLTSDDRHYITTAAIRLTQVNPGW